MKYVLIIMVLFTSTCSYCINNNENDKEIILYLNGYPINNNPTKEHFSYGITYPIVIQDNDIIKLTSENEIENAHIIITNKNGNIISDLHTNLSEYEFLIQLYEKDEYKIEIKYNNLYIYGFINLN